MDYLQDVAADAFGDFSERDEVSTIAAQPDTMSSATLEIPARSGLPSAQERGAPKGRQRQASGPGDYLEAALHGAELSGGVGFPRVGGTKEERTGDDGEQYRAGTLRNSEALFPGNAPVPSARNVLSTLAEAHQTGSWVGVSPRAEVPGADGEEFYTGILMAGAPGVVPGGQQPAPANQASKVTSQSSPAPPVQTALNRAAAGRASAAPPVDNPFPDSRDSAQDSTLRTEPRFSRTESAAAPQPASEPFLQHGEELPRNVLIEPVKDSARAGAQAQETVSPLRAETTSMANTFLHVAETMARLEPQLRDRPGRVPEHPEASTPRVHIGTVEIVVAAPAAPLTQPSAPSDLTSRRYLRRF